MSRCFASSSKLSAKEYIYKKRNNNIFCDLRKKYIANGYRNTGTPNACINNNGVIVKFNSHEDKTNVKKGFGQFLSISRQDLSKNYVGHQIRSDMNFCSQNTSGSNIDCSNNYSYHSPLLTLAYAGNTSQTIIVDSSGQYINMYAEIKKTTGITGTTKFPTGKKQIYELCGTDRPLRTGTRTQIIIGHELPTPIIEGFEIVFV
tara:strand:- start:693 stop:1301 length:609 start_codon:yes stop_codon:yes gene_type:complete